MGILSKIFKPVSKVLDKVIPNEIKPLLPYAAAFAPMFAPGIMYYKQFQTFVDSDGNVKSGGESQLFINDITGHNERQIITPLEGSDPAWSPLLH